MAAGLAQLTLLREHPGWYETLNETAGRFFRGDSVDSVLPWQALSGEPPGSLGCIFFTQGPVTNHPEAKTADTEALGPTAGICWTGGFTAPPASLRAMFLSMAHGDEELNRTLDTIRGYFREH